MTGHARWSLLVIPIALEACSPRIVRYGYAVDSAAIIPNCPLKIVKKTVVDPTNARLLGRVKITDNGFSMACGENDVVGQLKHEACAIKANLINIVEEHYPNILTSSCYRVVAELWDINQTDYR